MEENKDKKRRGRPKKAAATPPENKTITPEEKNTPSENPTPEVTPESEINTPAQESNIPPSEIPKVDLSEVLKQKIEVKAVKLNINDQGEEEKETPKPNPDDFGGEIPNDNPTEEPPQGEPAPEESEPGKKAADEYARSANQVVASLEALGKLGLPYAYSAKLFTDEEKPYLKELETIASYLEDPELAEKIYAKMEADKAAIMRGLFPKYKKYEKLCKGIDFEKEERKSLVQPLTEVFTKYDIGMGCEVALIIALFTVLASRLAPIFI